MARPLVHRGERPSVRQQFPKKSFAIELAPLSVQAVSLEEQIARERVAAEDVSDLHRLAAQFDTPAANPST